MKFKEKRRSCYRYEDRRRAIKLGLLLAVCLALQSCYYMQAVRGQIEVLTHRRPIDKVLMDPDIDPELKVRLKLLQEARRFATDTLLLPDNGSYRSYADLERDHVVWNVTAAPEFSLEPKTWCYPVVGCVAYRGYFAERGAKRLADRLQGDGYDVFVGGVAAYSTLGKFDDPFLNTMFTRSDRELVSLLFHELAHQRLYIRDDTEFNESFASAVAEIGLERWSVAHGEDPDRAAWQAGQRRQSHITRLFDAAKSDLRSLYAEPLAQSEMRARKTARLEQLTDDVRRAAGVTDGSWPVGALNNARLALITLYEGQVAAFLSLLDRCHDDLTCFYASARGLADLPTAARHDALASLERDYRDSEAGR